MSYEIKTHGRIGTELRKLAREEINRIIAALRTLKATTVDALTHDIRKRLKRLRALLRIAPGYEDGTGEVLAGSAGGPDTFGIGIRAKKPALPGA